MTYTLDEVIEMAERTDKLIERSEFHKDATEYLKQYREMRWHYPSKGEYPTERANYLVTLEIISTNERFISMAQYSQKYGWAGFQTDWYNIVAWMPLPEPPKEEA